MCVKATMALMMALDKGKTQNRLSLERAGSRLPLVPFDHWYFDHSITLSVVSWNDCWTSAALN